MSYLIFDFNRDLGQALARQLGAAVWVVQPGDRLARIDERTFTIDAGSGDDYQRLLDALGDAGELPRHVLHTWSRLTGSFDAGEIDSDLEMGLYSVFYLTRALMSRCGELAADEKLRLIYCYLSRSERHLPTFAALSGFARTVRMEQPQLLIKAAGIRDPEVAAQTLPVAHVLEVARREWRDDSDDDIEVFYSDRRRLVKRLKSLAKPAEPEPGSDQQAPLVPVRHGDIYLLTGGFGGLGVIFGRYLAAQAAVHLVLAGRSSLTPERERIVAELSAAGARVTSLRADLSQRAEVEQLIARINAMDGRLRGIIHSAGVTRDGFLLKKTPQEMAEVLAPKVHGTVALDQATRDLELDFFVMFSSLAAVLGNVGQSDYAYANSFMDAFAEWREELRARGLRHGRSLSINWPHWQDGGMQPSEQAQQWLRRVLGIEPLHTDNGVRALGDALASQVPQLVVLEGEGRRLRSELLRRGGAGAVAATEVADAPSAVAEARAYLVQLIARELKLAPERIRSSEPLESYGLDSNAVVRLNHTLEQDFGELSKTLLYEYQTIEELAGYLTDRHAARLPRRSPVPAAEAQQQPAVIEVVTPAAPAEAGSDDAIAIIGMSGRYPMADNLDQLWENLCAGRDCITEIPGERWDHSRYFDPERKHEGTSYSKWGGFLDSIDTFDPLFFNISPREAHTLDPQERLFLETAWHTIESAGYTRDALSGRRVGVFAGVMWGQYQLLGVKDIEEGVVPPAGSYASIANRVSYTLNLHGPSLAVDTMCSSSLTAIHLACRAIRGGECEMALAGGVNLIVHPARYLQLSREKFLASDGRCRAFGAGGDGYVPGEGVGAVLLKPLGAALTDGDRVLAVIRAGSLNHGGKTNGYRIPNPVAQGELIGEALARSGVTPQTISYIEAHGTGTALGDPIEINGLQRALAAGEGGIGESRDAIAMGTIKSNIGHLEGAAGIAGLTKVVLQMQHGRLVPSLHCERLNPNIDFNGSGFRVQTELADWPSSPGVPRRAGLSSFGAGGANGHLIIEGPPSLNERHSTPLAGPRLLLLSARSEERLRASAVQLRDFIAARTRAGAPQSATLLTEVLAVVAETIGAGAGELAAGEPLEEYGFDTMSVHALVEALNQTFELDLEPGEVTVQQTSGELAALIAERRTGAAGTGTAAAADRFFLEDLAYTLQVGREPLTWRLALLANDEHEAVSRLQGVLDGASDGDNLWCGRASPDTASPAGELCFPFDTDSGRGLVEAWVAGADIPWQQLYGEWRPRRIEAPLYPFARDRYWFQSPLNERPQTGPRLASHPLLQGPDMAASLDRGLVFSTVLAPELPLFSEHSLGPLPVFPGAGYLEMALAAAACVEPGTTFAVAGFTLLQPLFARGQAVTLRLRLWQESRSWSWQAESGDSNNPTVHASGRLRRPAALSPEPLALDQVRAACSHELDAETFYQRLDENGIGYGSYYRCLRQIHVGRHQALARYVLPEAGHQEHAAFHVHPVLLDGAFQALASLASGFGDGTRPLQMPFSADRVEMLQRPPRQGYAWVREDQETCQLVLADDQGQVCLRVSGLVLRPMPDFAEVAAAGVPARAAEQRSVFEIVAAAVTPAPAAEGIDVPRLLDGFQEVERFGALLVLAVFRELGVLSGGGLEHQRTQLMAQLGIAGGKRRMYDALVHIVTEQGWLELDGEQIRSTAALDDPVLAVDFAGLDQLRSQIGRQHPELVAHLNLLWACGNRLPEVLREQTAATDVLFPDASMHLVEPIYRGNPMADVINTQVVAAVTALVRARLPELQPGQHISILEVGAGTGGTSAQLLAALQPFAEHLRYCYTDVSAGFVQYGKQQFHEPYPFVEFRPLDIERNVLGQGFAASGHDLVVAANVLHATSDVANTLRQVKLLLKPHGLLILNEMVRFQVFTTVTFGLLDGWWAFANDGERLPHAPLLSAEGWQRRLYDEGFGRVLSVPGLTSSKATGENGEETEEPAAQQVLVAESDGLIDHLLAMDAERAVAAHPAGSKSRRAAGPSPATAGDTRSRIEAAIAATLDQVLELQQPDFDPRLPFLDYGVDSVLAVELINRLNQTLGIELRATDIFSYPSPDGLIEHITSHFGAELAAAPADGMVDTGSMSKAINTHDAAGTVIPFTSGRISTAGPAYAAAAPGDVAVIGMSGAFPGGDDLPSFWELLRSGGDGISEIPAARWQLDDWYDPEPQAPRKSISKWGGFLTEADTFDPLFFNLSPREAELIDPKQRKLLEHAWAALEDAGYSNTMLSNSKCGVFVGCRPSDYMLNLKEHDMEDNAYAFMGNSESILAARISYMLNLKGPAIAIDTACSSSLVAIHLACESLAGGTCDLALAGGVSIIGRPDSHILLSKIGMLSPTGRCRSFDQNADGIVPAEGVGVVVLKPLAAALNDRDPIHGVIKGSGINQDGTSKGLTAPSGLSQAVLIREVYERFQVDPETIGLVEAHGTGTKLGDPIEVHALTDAFANFTDRKQFCAIGSVKSNVGHALAAAGMSSLSKLLLCLKHRYLVPSIHLDQENEHIDFAATPFVPLVAGRSWDTAPGVPRRGVISSFGFSGTNAHLVVEEAPAIATTSGSRPAYLFPLSARDRAALQRRLKDLLRWLAQHGKHSHLGDIAATLQLGRSHHAVRCVVLASTLDELHRGLDRLGGDPEAHEIVNLKVQPRSRSTETHEGEAWIEELSGLESDPDRYRERLVALAELYLKEQDLPWERLYDGCRRLHLPTYPFAKKRFWIGNSPRTTADDRNQMPATGATTKMKEVTQDEAATPVPAAALTRQPQAAVTPDPGAEAEPAAGEILYYQPAWQHAPLAELGRRAAGVCLVFTDDPAWRPALEDQEDPDPVVIVHRGVALDRLGAAAWVIDPANPKHYVHLLEELQAENRLPRHVLCLWATEAAADDDPETITFRFAHHLVRALCEVDHQRPWALLFAHDLQRQQWLPRAEAVSAFGRSLGPMLPRLSLACVGLAGPITPEPTARLLAAELAALERPGSAVEIRYRGRRRYVAVNRALEVPCAGAAAAVSGTVLITGGAGGLGLCFARRLLQQGTNVVLLGRSPDGGEVARQALTDTFDISNPSERWMYLAADVTDEAGLGAALATARRRFGPLTGVIHAAGVRDDTLLTDKSFSQFRQNLAPKVEGTENLDRVTQDDPLDFFVLFSSTAAVLGDYGQGDYALANRFADGFAVQRERRRAAGDRHGRTMAINWPLWRDGGMRLTNAAAERFYVEVMGLHLLAETTGWSIFQRLLSAGHTRIIPVVGDRTRIEGLFSAESPHTHHKRGSEKHGGLPPARPPVIDPLPQQWSV